MGKQRAKAAGQKQLRVIAKHEEPTSEPVAEDTEQGNSSLPYHPVDFSSSRAGNGLMVLRNYSLVVPVWSLSDPFCLHEPCLQAAAGSSSEQDRQLSCLPPLAQNGSKLDVLLQPACQPGSGMADIVQLWRERRYRERTQLAFELVHGQQADTLLAEAAWAVMDLLPSTVNGWIQRIKVAAAAAQWASHQLAQQGLLLPIDGVLDAQGAVLPAQGMWLRSMLLLARTLHAAEATSTIGAGPYCASVPGDVVWLLSRLLPEDVIGARFMIMHLLSSRKEWEQLLSLCNCNLGCNLPADTLTLAVAYNKALAAFHVLGGEQPDALAAVAAALELDKCRWVPLLLGAGAMASPDLGPLLVLGSKQEATAYCHNHGVAWLIDSPWFQDKEEGGSSFKDGSPMILGPSLCWLLEKAGLQQLQQPLDKDRVSLVLLNTYSCDAAWRGVMAEVVEQMNVSYGAGTARIIPPDARPRLLRCELVLLCSLAASTANLPPVDAGPGLWVGVADMVKADISGVKERLVDCAKVVYDMARQLLQTCQAQQGPWQGAWPGELAHAAVTLAELQPARVRWLWQAGEIQWAKDAAADLLRTQQQLHRRSSSSSSAAGSGSLLQPALVLFSLQGVQAMQEFLNQQSLEACRSGSSKGSKGSSKSSRPASGSSSSSSRSRLTMVAGSSTGGSISSGGVRGSSRAVITYSPYEAVSKADEFCQLLFDAAGGLDSIEQVLQEGSTGPLTMQALRELQKPAAAVAGRRQQQQQRKWLQLLLGVSDKACACCGCIDLGLDGVENKHHHHHQQHRQQQQQQHKKQHVDGQPSSSRAPGAAAAAAAGVEPAASRSPAIEAEVAAAAAAAAAARARFEASSSVVQSSLRVLEDARPDAHMASLLLAVYQRMQDVYSVVVASTTAAAPVPQVHYTGSSGMGSSSRAEACGSRHTALDMLDANVWLLQKHVTDHLARLIETLDLKLPVTGEESEAAHRSACALAEADWHEQQRTLAALPAQCELLASSSSSSSNGSSSGSSSGSAQRSQKVRAAAGIAVDGVCDALKQLANAVAEELRSWSREACMVRSSHQFIADHQEKQQQRQQQGLEQEHQLREQKLREKLQHLQQLKQAPWRDICCTKLHLELLGQVLRMQHVENMKAMAAAAVAGEDGSSRNSSFQQQQQHAGWQDAEDELEDSDDCDRESCCLYGDQAMNCRCAGCSREAVQRKQRKQQQQHELTLPCLQQRLQDLWRSTAPAAAAAACAKLKHAAVMAGGLAAAEATAATTWEGLLELLAASSAMWMLGKAVEAAQKIDAAAQVVSAAAQSCGLQEEVVAEMQQVPRVQDASGIAGDMLKQVKDFHKCLDQAEGKLWGASRAAAAGLPGPSGALAAAAGYVSGVAGAGSSTATGSSGSGCANADVASVGGVKKRVAVASWESGPAGAGSSTASGSSGSSNVPGAAAAAAAGWQPAAAPRAPGQQASTGSSSNPGIFVFGAHESKQQQQQGEEVAVAGAAAGSTQPGNALPEMQGRQELAAASRRGSVLNALAALTSQLQLLGAQGAPGSGSTSAGSGSSSAASSGSTGGSGEGGSAAAGAGHQAAATPAGTSQVQHAAAVDVGQAAAAAPAPAGAPATAAANEAAGGSGGSSSGRSKVCAGCGQVFVKLRKCAGCASAGVYTGYCSEACQKEAWPVHKKECRGRAKQRQ